ncbi:MAG: Gfo/Idh/MocA family oxidoreductase [Planctomycetota bacterium]
MKLGIIGGGAVGRKHAEAIRAAEDEIAYVVDINAEAGALLADEFDAVYSATPDQLWADESVAAVVIAVPNFMHKPIAIAALNAGKDVLVEKPLALNSTECEEIGTVVDATGQLLQVGFVHRYTGVGKQAKSLIDAGALGEVYFAQAVLFLRRGVPGLGRWFTNRDLSGGGTLIDVGVHLIDLSLYLLDFPEVAEVHGQTFSNFGARMEGYAYEEMWSGPPDLTGVCNVEDAAHALVRFSSGAVLDLHVAWAGNYPNKFMPTSCVTVCGPEGGLAFELFGKEVQLTKQQAGKVVDESLAVADNDFFLDQYLDFRSCIESRILRQAGHRQASITQGIVDAVYRCSRENHEATEVNRQAASLAEN